MQRRRPHYDRDCDCDECWEIRARRSRKRASSQYTVNREDVKRGWDEVFDSYRVVGRDWSLPIATGYLFGRLRDLGGTLRYGSDGSPAPLSDAIVTTAKGKLRSACSALQTGTKPTFSELMSRLTQTYCEEDSFEWGPADETGFEDLGVDSIQGGIERLNTIQMLTWILHAPYEGWLGSSDGETQVVDSIRAEELPGVTDARLSAVIATYGGLIARSKNTQRDKISIIQKAIESFRTGVIIRQ